MYYCNLVIAKIRKAFECDAVRRVYFTLIIFAAWLAGLITYQATNSVWQTMAVCFVVAAYGCGIITIKKFNESSLDILPFTTEEVEDTEDIEEESEYQYCPHAVIIPAGGERDNLDEIDQIAEKELFEIRRTSNAKAQLKQATDDIEKLGKLRATIKKLETVIYKKAIMSIVKSTYNNLRIYILQNIRGITAICIAGQALGNKELGEDEIAKIEEQLENNRTAFESFQKLLKEVPSSFRSAADSAVQLDIETSITAIKNFNATSNKDA